MPRGGFYANAWFGDTFISGSGNSYDVFVAKYDNQGHSVWIKTFGSGNQEYGRGIAVDQQGNVLVVGTFQGYAQFASTNMTSISGNDDVFIAKLNADGELQWVRQVGGSGSDIGAGSGTDTNGNVFVTGYFIGSATFGTENLSTIVGSYDGFLTRLDPNGQFVWTKQFGGGDHNYPQKLAVDDQGHIYITGYFADTAVFEDRAAAETRDYLRTVQQGGSKKRSKTLRVGGSSSPSVTHHAKSIGL